MTLYGVLCPLQASVLLDPKPPLHTSLPPAGLYAASSSYIQSNHNDAIEVKWKYVCDWFMLVLTLASL